MSQRILLFDSDANFADEVRHNFQAMGATVDVANDGPQGIELASTHRPDLILLTIELPGMNGFLVCKKIKKQEDLQNVPLLILSSEATEDVFEQHKKLRTRAEDYIHKPIAFADLLERVKRFVPLETNGSSAAGGAEDAIEIDDFEDEEVILVADDADVVEAEPDEIEALPEPEALAAVAAAPPVNGQHADARAFANSAIDALMTDDDADEAAVVSRMSSKPPPFPSSQPPAAAVPQAAPVPQINQAVNNAELARVRQELDAAHKRQAQLEAEVASLDARARNAEQELQAAKQRSASAERSLQDAAKKGGVSSREFLDLREQLNRKDRELLALRDQVSSRDKQLIEQSDKSLHLERELADVGDQREELQAELAKLKELVESLQADKDGAKKRLDDMKARLERAEAKARELGDELGGVKAVHAKELDARDQREAEARAALLGQHSIAIEELNREQSAAIDALRRVHGDELSDLKEAHEVALGAARQQAEQQKQEGLSALRSELEARSAEALAEAQRQHELVVSQALAAHEKELTSARDLLQSKHAAELREANDRHQQDLGRLGRSMAELETKRQILQDQYEEAEAGRTDALARLATTTSDRDQKATLVTELQAQLDRALAQRAADEQVLERAHKAFAIGLALLEEHKNR
jgi:CheY-like chemotaxis protein